MDTIKPMITHFLIDSLRTTGESSATQSGVVVTRTTELATEVSCSEVIQTAKWIARKSPDRPPFKMSFHDRLRHSWRYFTQAIGTRTRLANNNLDAAITNEDASACANRMNIDAVETNRIPKAVPRIG